jgi:hypothetical protein
MNEQLDFTEGILENFRDEITEYHQIEKTLKKLKNELEPIHKRIVSLKQRKQEIKKSICSFMNFNNVDICNMPKEIDDTVAFKYSQSQALVPLTHEHIKNGISKFFEEGLHNSEEFRVMKPSEKGAHLFDYIKQNRPRSAKEYIRKVKQAVIDVEQLNMEYEILENIK